MVPPKIDIKQIGTIEVGPCPDTLVPSSSSLGATLELPEKEFIPGDPQITIPLLDLVGIGKTPIPLQQELAKQLLEIEGYLIDQIETRFALTPGKEPSEAFATDSIHSVQCDPPLSGTKKDEQEKDSSLPIIEDAATSSSIPKAQRSKRKYPPSLGGPAKTHRTAGETTRYSHKGNHNSLLVTISSLKEDCLGPWSLRRSTHAEHTVSVRRADQDLENEIRKDASLRTAETQESEDRNSARKLKSSDKVNGDTALLAETENRQPEARPSGASPNLACGSITASNVTHEPVEVINQRDSQGIPQTLTGESPQGTKDFTINCSHEAYELNQHSCFHFERLPKIDKEDEMGYYEEDSDEEDADDEEEIEPEVIQQDPDENTFHPNGTERATHLICCEEKWEHEKIRWHSEWKRFKYDLRTSITYKHSIPTIAPKNT
eukprot:Gb_14104 [translate_table: standard]